MFFFVVTDFTVELAMDRVPFEEVGKRFRVVRSLIARTRSTCFCVIARKTVAPDAPEAVDCVICHRSVEGAEELKR